MIALIKVRSSAMKDILDRIKKFQVRLTDQEDLGKNWYHNLNEDLNIVKELQSEQRSLGYSKKHETHIIKHEKFQRRYYSYIIRVVLCFMLLIAINIWDAISTTNANKVIYNRIETIQYALFVNNRVSSAYGSFPVLFLTNNTLLVEHKTALQAIFDSAAEIKKIQNEVIYKFKEIDGDYNPAVKAIIFENDPSCYGATDNNKVNCGYLVVAGQPTNMLSTLSVFQSILANKYQDYLMVQNSTNSSIITAAAYRNIETFLPSFVVLAYETQLIADIIDQKLAETIQETKDHRLFILVIFCLGLLLVSLIIWFFIFKQIREVYNDFKKVLQIFPPGLVLSSYLLKKFLVATSNHSDLL